MLSHSKVLGQQLRAAECKFEKSVQPLKTGCSAAMFCEELMKDGFSLSAWSPPKK